MDDLYLQCVDESYFSALFDYDELYPISDVNYAHELLLQEVLLSPLSLENTPSSVLTVRRIDRNPEKIKFFVGESSNCVCGICMDAKSNSEIFGEIQCNHSFCNDCIEQYVATKVKESAHIIPCPEPGCTAKLDIFSLRDLVPKEVLERWDRIVCESLISESEKFYCPFKDCSSLLLYEQSDFGLTQTECPLCHRLFCAQCKIEWHVGLTCGELKSMNEEKENEMALMKFAEEKKWRRCPKCMIFVEKKDGCNHITCRCRNEFCYLCGSKWRRDHVCS